MVVLHHDVRGVFERAVNEARRSGRPRVVSVAFPAEPLDPIDVFAEARAQGETAALWQLPARGVAIVGIGAEAELTAEGPDRFGAVARQWRALVADAVVVGDAGGATHPGPGPVAMGGFAFDVGGAAGPWAGFGDGWLCLPRTMYGVADRKHWLTVNTTVTQETEPAAATLAVEQARRRMTLWTHNGVPVAASRDADESPVVAREAGSAMEGVSLPTADLPDKQSWLAAVERVSEHIRAGRLEKAVLARSVRVELPAQFSVRAALMELRQNYPECYIFAVGRGDASFVGATPERVVHLEQGRVKVACMAGSTGRGATEAEDRTLGEALLADAKNVEEHEVVLRSILTALAPVCVGVTAGTAPSLRKLANVQHLYTPVTARVAGDRDILDLVSRVHPTPAIGGHPTADALELIAAEEQMHRGWYAGPIGWINVDGEGEFAVGLRSGLLRPGEARLFAGCGIMGDSEPESEYTESVLKLRPMMKALEAGTL